MSPLPEPLPSFHDAVARFRVHLKSYGRPETIVWIELADLLIAHGRLHVRLRTPLQMWNKAQCRYDVALNSKRGAAFRHVCQVPGMSCCYVDVVESPGLSLLLPDEPRRAIPVASRLHWLWLRARGREAGPQAMPSTIR